MVFLVLCDACDYSDNPPLTTVFYLKAKMNIAVLANSSWIFDNSENSATKPVF